MGADRHSPTAPRRVLAAERRRQALEMRATGMTYTAIGSALGVSDVAAGNLVRNALKDLAQETADSAGALRALEAERLDAVSAALYPRAVAGDLRAVDRYVRVRESYRKLLGLDAEREVGAEVNFNIVTSLPWDRPGGEVVDGVAEEAPASELEPGAE